MVICGERGLVHLFVFDSRIIIVLRVFAADLPP